MVTSAGERDASDGEGERAAIAAELLSSLRPASGIRVVAHYAPECVGTVFVREDVRQQFTDREMHKPIKDAVLDSLATGALEELLDDDHLGTVRVFERRRILYCSLSELSGVIVSLDSGAELNDGDVFDAFEEVVSGG